MEVERERKKERESEKERKRMGRKRMVQYDLKLVSKYSICILRFMYHSHLCQY